MRYPKQLLFISAALLVAPFSALSQVTPLIFERTAIRIESPPAREKDATPKPTHAPLPFEVEVRPEDALRLEYIHTLNSLSDASGVMIAFTAPSMVPLPTMKVYTAVDALFVADDGTVTQILPNTVLGELNQQIMAREPIKAFLFLKAGSAAARGIRPRDVVAGPMFTPAPPFLE